MVWMSLVITQMYGEKLEEILILAGVVATILLIISLVDQWR
jgi:hypothetical protein